MVICPWSVVSRPLLHFPQSSDLADDWPVTLHATHGNGAECQHAGRLAESEVAPPAPRVLVQRQFAHATAALSLALPMPPIPWAPCKILSSEQ